MKDRFFIMVDLHGVPTPYCRYAQKKITDMTTCPLMELNKARNSLLEYFGFKKKEGKLWTNC